jgi:hypothetical protein
LTPVKPEQNQWITVGEINPERDASELLTVRNVDVLWRLRAVIVFVWGFILAQDVVMSLKELTNERRLLG